MTKKILLTIAALAVSASAAVAPAQFQSPSASADFHQTTFSSTRFVKTFDVNIAGEWTLTVNTGDQQLQVLLELTQAEKTFSGTMSSQLGNGKVTKGTLKESEFTAVVQANIQGQDMEIQMSGKLDGEKMTGTFTLPNADAVAFEGTKAKSN